MNGRSFFTASSAAGFGILMQPRLASGQETPATPANDAQRGTLPVLMKPSGNEISVGWVMDVSNTLG